MNEILQNRSSGSFSLSKIPFNEEKTTDEKYDIDRIKILELSNIIDKWEEEVLFSDGGYFSLKGKEVQNKSKEFITELSDFIGDKILECSFENGEAKQLAYQIKTEKISSISEKMKIYEQAQLLEWENSVYETAIASCIKRAVLYKNDENIILKSFQNGISVLKIMSEKEQWNTKTIKAKTDKFRSDFYYSIIKSFMAEKEINAYKYFSKFKDDLLIDNKDALEKSLELLKSNVIAYNLAKEIYSYKLDEKETDKYTQKINDKTIEKSVQKYLKIFIDTQKKEKLAKEKEEKEQNWQTVLSEFDKNADDVLIAIDYSLPEEHISAVKKYIEKRQKNGFINSDKEQFIQLIKEMFENFQSFVQKDISDYRADLSLEDFDIILNFQKMKQEEFDCLYSDYKYSCRKLSEMNICEFDEQYEYAKLYLKLISEYKRNSNKNADLKVRNDIINTVLQRFTDKSRIKEEQKEGETK